MQTANRGFARGQGARTLMEKACICYFMGILCGLVPLFAAYEVVMLLSLAAEITVAYWIFMAAVAVAAALLSARLHGKGAAFFAQIAERRPSEGEGIAGLMTLVIILVFLCIIFWPMALLMLAVAFIVIAAMAILGHGKGAERSSGLAAHSAVLVSIAVPFMVSGGVLLSGGAMPAGTYVLCLMLAVCTAPALVYAADLLRMRHPLARDARRDRSR